MNSTIDQLLKDTEFIKRHSWGKIVTHLKRQFDAWATDQLVRNGYKNFKIAYMPVLMNIGPDGRNNNDLAKHARVSKQAMSKVIQDLLQSGYIKTKADEQDKRSMVLHLTDKGKKLVVETRLCVKSLMDEYRQEVGDKEFEQALSVLVKILDYNDRKSQDEGRC